MTPQPELAVVVIGVGAPADLVDAVGSLLGQGPLLEIVVVNTGGGDAARLLANAGRDVPVVERPERLPVGAARNLGITATRAPWVAFLASDCLARPGWAAARIGAHRAGAAVVASAMVNSHPASLVAWAAHLVQYWRRLPGTGPERALCYGCSYARTVFAQHGGFREDLMAGEDTEFNGRLPESARPVWCAAVQTAHRNPTRLGAFLADQYRRGGRMRHAYGTSMGRNRGPRFAGILAHSRQIVTGALEAVLPGERRLVARARPLLVLGLFWRYLGWRAAGGAAPISRSRAPIQRPPSSR